MRLSGIWLKGLLARRWGRTLATSGGIAMAVALLASLGSFLDASQTTMTIRSVATVAVDWQVEAQPGADFGAVLSAVRAQAHVTSALPVDLATIPGLAATTNGTTQTTGQGVVVGLPDGYTAAFPGEIRALIGNPAGVAVSQQTAANLHVRPGDVISIERPGTSPSPVTLAAVVDLPQADSLFQKVGSPPGSQLSAPPDNVLLLPANAWRVVFDQSSAGSASPPRHQVHVGLDRALPASPESAFDQVSGASRNLEIKLAGTGLVGNNLAAALGAARSDAAYATVMFLFLGVPGAALAGLLTAVVAATGASRRRREQALLRSRGASTSTLIQIALLEAGLAGFLGSVLGLAAALLIGALAFGSPGFGADVPQAAIWAGAAALTGLVIAVLVIAVPARRHALQTTVAGARLGPRGNRLPRWARLGLALILLGGALAGYIATNGQGYHLVLAPEGVPGISVNYLTFAGPACLWIGAAVLTWWLADLLLSRGRRLLAGASRPVAGALAGTVTATMRRQRSLLAPAVALVALSAAFAASTAVFNSTYAQQAEVDARLTNGSDVTVSQPPGTVLPAGTDARLAAISGVRGVEPLLHRFAYVGADLQDLYGVRAGTITAAGSLQDAYFQGGTATEVMSRLAAYPDGVLVSAETVKDFQLQPDDHVTLRLQDTRTRQLVPVTFRYVGVAKEFPTAPRDSFLVANAGYVAQATGDPSVTTYLIDSGGNAPASIAASVRATFGAGPQVTDITSSRHVVGSSLTAVDLNGLTKVELGFALVFAVGSTGLVLALGLAERRRTFALIAALGARPHQLAAFLWSEAGFILVGGLVVGSLLGWALSKMLVAVLTGVFDPPPTALAIPWVYLGIALALSVVAVVAVVLGGTRALRRSSTPLLREL